MTNNSFKNPLILLLFCVLIRLMKSDFLFFVIIKMSKKIILLSAIVMCAFIYGCGSQKDSTDIQQTTTENLRANENETDIAGINETTEIPVAQKNGWEPIVVQWWGRGGDAVEINETFEEDIN